MPCSLKADYTLINGRLVPDVVVSVGRDGRITELRDWTRGGDRARSGGTLPDRGEVGTFAPVGRRVQRLRGRVLVPGFVNAHSHSFQRLLRGRTEYQPVGVTGDDFWSWRTAMYRAAESLDPEAVEAVAAFAFAEMTRAGFTHVAEFHYLHHQPDGTPYADPLELTRRVLEGADRAGIGITLLRVAYQRGGAEVPLTQEQRRFSDPTPAQYAAALEATEALADPQAQRPVHVGIAAHSVRALDRAYLAALAELAGDRLVHAHVAEQPKEIEQCVAEHGIRPVQLLADLGLLNERFTAVHATHLDPTEIRLLGESAITACICPTTERNLGDGLPALREMRQAGVRFAIGSDSHARIDPFAELRALEDGERLRLGRRNVLTGGQGMDHGVAEHLFRVGSAGRAVGLDCGSIEVGQRADLVALSIDDPAVAGVAEGRDGADALLAALILGGGARQVRDVWVGGKHLVEDGVHLRWDAVLSRYRTVAAKLWA